MVRLKVCPCFRFSEREEFMEPVANRPWDAWHVIDDGKRFIINYVSDGFYDYLKHLLQNPKCRQSIGLDYNTVLVWFSVKEGKKALFSACWHRPARETMQYEPEPQQELHDRGDS
jgi:hypothetical protein